MTCSFSEELDDITLLIFSFLTKSLKIYFDTETFCLLYVKTVQFLGSPALLESESPSARYQTRCRSTPAFFFLTMSSDRAVLRHGKHASRDKTAPIYCIVVDRDIRRMYGRPQS